MSSTEQSGPVTRTPRWVKIALIASVSLNMLIVGFAAGAVWKFRHGGWHEGRRASPMRALGWFARDLPDEKRERIRAIVERERPTIRGLRTGIRQKRQRLRDVLVAPEFDRAAYQAAQQDYFDAILAVRRRTAAMIPEIAEELTQAERQALAQLITRRGRRKYWRRHRRDD